jgi:hypothetical protein
MTIVSTTILLSYLVEGRDRVQATVLDITFCFVAAALLMTAGGGLERIRCRATAHAQAWPA